MDYTIREVAPGRLYAAGFGNGVGSSSVLTALPSVRTIVAITLGADVELKRLATEAGVEYRHEPLRAGSSPRALRRIEGIAKMAARAGAVLIVGETAGGPALRIADSLRKQGVA